MTCAACTVTVRKSLAAVEGVKDATVTVDPPQAIVVYDPATVSTDAFTKATAQSGYPSVVKDAGNP